VVFPGRGQVMAETLWKPTRSLQGRYGVQETKPKQRRPHKKKREIKVRAGAISGEVGKAGDRAMVIEP